LSRANQMNEIIHLRIARSLYDIINKLSHESGLSKQDVIRQMIISQLETKYGDNIMMNITQVKQQIKNEYENPKIPSGMDPLQD
jgi:hypothetical protein